ncbi:MAG: ABC transporter substrate-binding protein [Alphaproteobacteria bacterium]|nr:ABC transporter substrate-binding protein [Alphaproteobacteria bacterium]
MKRTLIAALSAALLLATARPGMAQDKMTVLLDWFVNPDHAALVVARDKGFFADQDLEVELIAPADPNDPPKLVAAGKADVAVSYQPQLHMMADQGLPLVRVGTLVDQPLNSLVVLADGPVKSIADLKGARIGYSVGGFEDALLGAMLKEAGLSLDDIELINVNWSLSPSLIAGQTDAVIGAFRNFELNQMDIEGHPGRAFLPEDHGVPAYDELILLSSSHGRDDPRLPRFLRALEDATAFVQENPAEAWEVFIAAYPDLDDELNRRAWKDTVPLLADKPAKLDAKRYYDFAAFMLESGLIESSPELHVYAEELPVPCNCSAN